MSYSAIHNYVSAVESYYQINDVFLNVRKINKFMPEHVKVRQIEHTLMPTSVKC